MVFQARINGNLYIRVFYTLHEVQDLIENEELIDSLQPESAYLLGRYVAENRVHKRERPDLFLVSERISRNMDQLQSKNTFQVAHSH